MDVCFTERSKRTEQTRSKGNDANDMMCRVENVYHECGIVLCGTESISSDG